MRKVKKVIILFFLSVLVMGQGPSTSEPAKTEQESANILIYVEPFQTNDPSIEKAELHLIARELFVNALAASKKFTFAKSPQTEGVEMVLLGTIATTPEGLYNLNLLITRSSGPIQQNISESGRSMEELVRRVADAVSKIRKRTGYIIKREGNRIVIARGSQDGVSVGQRYRTTDTFEEFVITKVTAQTAEGRIIGGSAPVLMPEADIAPKTGEPGKPSEKTSGELGSVDIVFVIDTTSSMWEEISGVLNNCVRFADRLASKGINAHLGLVTFRVGVRKVYGLTPDVEVFKSWVQPLRHGGGGDETPFRALARAMELDFRPDAKRIFVLITDEPASDAISDAKALSPTVQTGCGLCCGGVHRYQEVGLNDIVSKGVAERVLQGMRKMNGVVFSVTIVDKEGIYQYLAQQTGGAFYDLEQNQDFSALLETMGKKIEGMFVEM